MTISGFLAGRACQRNLKRFHIWQQILLDNDLFTFKN